MKQLKLRFGRPDEASEIVDWLQRNSLNKYDPDTVKNQTTRILCAYDEDGAQAYIPIEKFYMLGSFAPKPGINRSTAAQALRDFTKAALLMASGEGLNEVYFLDGDGGVAEFAKGNHYELLGEQVGDKFVPYKVYRIKV